MRCASCGFYVDFNADDREDRQGVCCANPPVYVGRDDECDGYERPTVYWDSIACRFYVEHAARSRQ